ncbi:malate:quinone oxidoreductase [Candidatus Carsonella ruddii]|uniref:malate dehydrogenase (quinone) n=1 Tax=Carsonella ruddii TaxID=114186 RepID=A0AAE7G5G8_CARRU|nr:malate:quinone oxidoreductase [Candidatus Carsonella ruddii]QLK14094.1 hypothetical protein FK493_00710 [Candidatus Carsonella ruddii]
MSYIITIIGAGVVSAVTSLMIHLLNKKNKVIVFEMNNKISIENSKANNNAGTGHAGMCENNYVKVINNEFYIKKNIRINYKFNLTKNLLSWVKLLKIFDLKNVITQTPHISYFFLKNNVKLKKIFKKIRIFNKSLKFTNNKFLIDKICPLIIKNKKIKKNYSLTYYKKGFDINYQYLSEKIFHYLTKLKKIYIFLSYKIISIKKIKKFFSIKIFKNGFLKIISNFVFVCAGGNSLSFLKNFNKKISKNFFELPIDGSWLISENKNLIKKHNLKIYSETLKCSPPMSIPHLDIRTFKKEKKILFGPFAGLTFNILTNSKKTILKNLNLNHIFDLIIFSIKNYSIMNYLIKESIKTKNKKIKNIYSFSKSFKLLYCKKAGKRLQILKKKNKFLKLNFGTKVIFNKNKQIAFLLGASPGASIAASIAKKVLNKWFFNNNLFFIDNIKNTKKTNIFNSILYLKGIEPFSL